MYLRLPSLLAAVIAAVLAAVLAVAALGACGDNAAMSGVPDAAPSGHPDAAMAMPDAAPPPSDATPPTVNAGADQEICAGASVAIGPTAQAGFTYAWSPATGLDSATSARPTASPAATTTYTLTVTETATGASASDSVVVTVDAPVASAGGDQTTDPGAAVILGAPAVAGQTYAWTCDRPSCALSSTSDAQPSASPAASTTYTVVASAGSVGCTATASATVWTNLHASTQPDGVTTGTATSPWPVSARLMVTFDQPVDAATLTTGTVTLTDVLTGTPIPVTLSFDAAAQRLYVTPGTGYTSNTDYTLTLAGNATGILTTDALHPSRLPGDQFVDFTTGVVDNTAPGVASSVPANSATNVPLNQTIDVTFNEIVDPATVTGTTFVVRDSTAGTAIAGTLTYDAGSLTAHFVPAAALVASHVYTIVLNGIADLSGNAMSNVQLSFSTGSSLDVIPPTVTAFFPTGTNVSPTTNVTVTFSEAIDSATLGGLVVAQTIGGTPVTGTVTYNALTFVATFTPAQVLAGLTSYTISVSGVKDLAGNVMAATQTSVFTTAKVLFLDDFESGTGKWTLTGTAGLATSTYRSSSHSLSDSPTGTYAQSATITATTIAIDVTGTSTVTVQWQQRTRTSKNKDFVYMQYSLDGGATWANLKPRVSGNAGWALQSVSGIATAGKTTLNLRYQLVDNGDARQLDGFYIDDVVVQTP